MGAIDTTGQRMIALCILGCLLFNYPILALFNSSGSWFGVPALYAFVFVAWAALIAAMAFVVDRRE